MALSVPADVHAANRGGVLIGRLARSRELTLACVTIVMVTFVAIKAPSFLASTNLISVTALTAIIAIAAVGEALVIITKNIDLSVESTMGLVAFVVAIALKQQSLTVPEAWAIGIGLGLVMYGISEGPVLGWGTARVLVTAIAGAALLVVMVFVM